MLVIKVKKVKDELIMVFEDYKIGHTEVQLENSDLQELSLELTAALYQMIGHIEAKDE